MNPSFERSMNSLLKLLSESSQRSSLLHDQFLRQRGSSLQDVKTLIELQMTASIAPAEASASPAQPVAYTPSPALFDSRQLDAFGHGKLSDCLGPAFAAYDTRRIPRIPNGDLKMMTRVTAIEGQPRNFNAPASISVEYDVPVDAWYLRDNAAVDLPTAVYMEIALQPCGFLSAYLDTYAFVPHSSYFFRNLDGQAWLSARVDVRGKTITTRAKMLNSVVSGGTVIQKFAFEVSCAGQVVYQGESTFGYFSTETMANQVGLDGGKAVQPWLSAHPEQAAQVVSTSRWKSPRPEQPDLRLSSGRLNFLDEVQVVKDGGRYGSGYVYASRPVNPLDWFYPYHFYQDPVMPGSLGVEAVMQAVQTYALHMDLGRGLRRPVFGLPAELNMNWRYRGQITPQHRRTELEVHFKTPERRDDGLVLAGDASLWVDGLRIYEIKNAAVAVLEG